MVVLRLPSPAAEIPKGLGVVTGDVTPLSPPSEVAFSNMKVNYYSRRTPVPNLWKLLTVWHVSEGSHVAFSSGAHGHPASSTCNYSN